MRKSLLLQTTILICCIIVFGFIGNYGVGTHNYSRLAEEDIENISRLTTTNIYADIENEMTKPIYVARTIANDTFLQSWLEKEKNTQISRARMVEIREYLSAMQKRYGYDTVSVISDSSKIYYYQAGVNKVMSRENAHDVWYYDFLSGGDSYKLMIDTDETNDDILTLFVNCRIDRPDSILMGVVGVGVRMSRLQGMLAGYEQKYDLHAYLIDENGLIQAASDETLITNRNLFDLLNLKPLNQDAITREKDTLVTQWYPADSLEHCLISRYIDTMGWYLVIEKDTEPLRRTFQRTMLEQALIMAGILVLLLLVTARLIIRHNRLMDEASATDRLTGIANRTRFERAVDLWKAEGAGLPAVLFIFDVDRFKEINDQYGHLAGDDALIEIAHTTQRAIGENGFVARWGGDEFSGLIFGTREEAERILRRMQDGFPEIRYGAEGRGGISASVGVTVLRPDDDIDSALQRADYALYHAKSKGQNLCQFAEDFPEL